MTANIQQVFDLNQDPQDKERLLSGQVNMAVCQACGYQSAIGIPLVYHDPEKELLLTYFPSEMGVSINEQEKIIGPLINQVVGRLPMEMRKGYLFTPQSMLTYDTLIEKILEADGITKEMLQDQENKLSLLKRLLTAADDSIPEIVEQEAALIDQSFFALFSNVQASAMQSGDEGAKARIKAIQDVLLEKTAYGQELKKRAVSTQKALQDLQSLGEKLNRDSLLELVLQAPDDAYLQTLTGIARNGMDYEFFTALTARIEAADEADKAKYASIRENLLAMIQQIDSAVQEQHQLRKQVFDEIMKDDNLEQGIAKYARAIDESFLQIANQELSEARKQGDFARSGKIQNLLDTIEKMSKVPAEVEFLETLLEKADGAEISAALEENKDKVTDEFKKLLDSLVDQLGNAPNQQPELVEKLKLVQKIVKL
jgi:hypothetical protein